MSVGVCYVNDPAKQRFQAALQGLGTLRAQMLGDHYAALANVLRAFFAIGHMAAVGNVEQRLVGQ